MDKAAVIDKTEEYVKKTLTGDGSGHDWWHIYRVWLNAKHIGKTEKAEMFVVELAALLHDISDWKFNNGDAQIGAKVAQKWLESLGVDEATIGSVYEIIATVSFKGAGVKAEMKTIEGKIVQDADRLDAMGAIGIGRTFTYGGYAGREMYDPSRKPEQHATSKEYIASNSPTINHFYEKLLLLKDLMNTQSAKEIAQSRHKYMEEFLERFFAEWNGER